MSYKTQRIILLTTFLAIPLLLLAMFLVYPTVRLLYMSFTDWDGLMPPKRFVGFNNYIVLFSDPEMFLTFKNNLIYAVNGFLQNILALLLAVVLTSRIRGWTFFRSLIFMPNIINSVAVAFMFVFIFDFEKSPINLALQSIGLGPVDFIGSMNLVNYSLAGVSMWRYLGMTMVIYIAALQSVPEEIYESAKIDGAGGLQTLRFITVPSIRRIVELNLFLTLSGALTVYTEPMVITNGGPGTASRTFVYSIIVNAFEANRFSYAAAMAVVLIVITLLITGVQRKIVLREG